MTYTFESRFAARIEDFIAQKNALGFGYLESSRLLRGFDRFCMTHFPEENSLTEELCLAWATKKDTEGNNTFRNRMMPVREFARYLNRNGEAAYVLPPDIDRRDAPYVLLYESTVCQQEKRRGAQTHAPLRQWMFAYIPSWGMSSPDVSSAPSGAGEEPIWISCHLALVMRSWRGLEPSKGPTYPRSSIWSTSLAARE